jgi:hypothetical protein
MSASAENGSFILQAAITEIALRNRMTVGQVVSTEEATSPVLVTSVAAVIRQTP